MYDTELQTQLRSGELAAHASGAAAAPSSDRLVMCNHDDLQVREVWGWAAIRHKMPG